MREGLCSPALPHPAASTWPGAAQQRTWVAVNQGAPCYVWQGPGEPRDVFLKVASGPSPEIKDFFVIIYA